MKYLQLVEYNLHMAVISKVMEMDRQELQQLYLRTFNPITSNHGNGDMYWILWVYSQCAIGER